MKKEDTKGVKCWKRKTVLEKRLSISLILSLFLLSGLILYVGLQNYVIAKPCNTPACLLSASQIISHIDSSIDPCDDFFKFSCGKFIKHTHGDIKATSIKELEEQVERQMTEIIKEPTKDDDHFLVKKQKELLKICMNDTTQGEDATEIFNSTLKEFNGWPVVIGPAWNDRLFDWKDLTYKLREKGYPHEMMLDFTAIEDVEDTDKYALYVSEPYVPKIKEEKKEFYKQYMVEVAVKFGADETFAAVEMEKVVDFMEKMRAVADKNTFNSDNDTCTNATAELLKSKFTIDDYQKNYTKINWLPFLNNILKPKSKLYGHDYVFFPNDAFMTEFLDLIERTPKRIQANYMIWYVLEIVISFLSKDLRELENNYACLTDDSSPPKERFKFCNTVISRTFNPLPSYIVYARRYLPQEKKIEIQEMLHNIKAELIDLLLHTSWMDSKSRERVVEKMNAITEVIGAPGDYFDNSVFEKLYSKEDFPEYNDEMNFVEILLLHMKFRTDMIFSQISKPSNETRWEMFYHFVAKVNAMYSPSDNAILLPVGILQGLFYNSDRPNYLNYGTLGSIIGHELTHALGKEASKYDKNGKEVNMWTEQTENAFDAVSNCIIEDAESFDVEDTEKTINGTLTLEENLADFTGIKASYLAYKKWIRKHGDEPQLSGIKYTPNQMFWISAISYECFKLSGDSLEKSLKYDSHAHNAFRATGPMRNNPDFARDFNCPTNSNMNPTKKCQVF